MVMRFGEGIGGGLIAWHGVRKLLNVVTGEWVDADGLADWVDGISAEIGDGVVQHGHSDGGDHGARVSERTIDIMETLELPVSDGVGGNTGKQLACSAQLGRRLIAIRLRDGSVRGHRAVHQGRAAAGVDAEVVEHLVLGSFLGVDHFLQGQYFIDEQSVSLRDLSKELLELLDLLLGGSKLLGNDANVLARGEVLGWLRFSRSGGLATDIIQVIFAVYSEVRVLEFENLRGWLEYKA